MVTPSSIPQWQFLVQVAAELDDPQILSDVPLGIRRIVYVKGGSVRGPELVGQVLPGGGDWVLLRHDGVAELDIRFTLSVGDSELIYVRSRGIFDVSPQVRARIGNGEDVDATEYYFRTSLVLETGVKKFQHLNRLLAFGIGRRTKVGMVTDIFLLR